MLIASDGENVLGWHLARTENSRAWSALMTRIAEPEVAVSAVGDGLAKALKRACPGTRHQSCVSQVFSQV
ncbi:transposase [Collinsella intestinalis]|uniref:transposase n=1 Tax=Collinsella intestinalis TaxID=147207 RepID=UPI0025A338CD|nr:transposase [Collinsella intestinalis]MDM8162324.1 transposase [Collinsella intestinalis]